MKRFIVSVVFAVGFGAVCANAAEWYVHAGSGNNSNDGKGWGTAKQTIQAAVDIASANDTVWVADGTYNTGMTVTPLFTLNNRVVITKNLTVRSLNGPEVTIIEGAGGAVGSTAVRGVYMSAGTLSGFTITDGHTETSGDLFKDQSGGGVFCENDSSVVTNCTFSGNSADHEGGGMYKGTVNHCTFSGNMANYGGGLRSGTATHCIFSGNTANDMGGGMFDGTAINCTLSGNTATRYAGGMYHGTATNCIVWGNTAAIGGDNLLDTTARFTCSPDLTYGSSGNITNNPQFVAAGGDYHLQYISSCIDAGDNGAVSHSTDLDGNPRISNGTVDMGAYEVSFHYVVEGNSGAQSPFTSWGTAAATIQDAVDAASVNALVLVTNGTYNTGTTVTPGYALNNRVVITKDLTVRSVNGPDVTLIEGAGPLGSTAVRGVYMSAGTLSGFTVMHGHTQTTGDSDYDESGGGIFCPNTTPVVAHCIVSENRAHFYSGGMLDGTANFCLFILNISDNSGGGMSSGIANFCNFKWNETDHSGGGMQEGAANNCEFIENRAGWGGGKRLGTADNCTFIRNSADHSGGGMLYGVANNCTFSKNWADEGGGMYSGAATNCIVWDNGASISGNDLKGTTASYTCSSDVTHGSSGNITNNPQFVDASWDDFHLPPSSRCVNAGNNAAVSGVVDRDGDSRIFGGTVDMGAYEFSGYWGDSDGDGMSDDDEQIAGTDIFDFADFFRIESVVSTGGETTVVWTPSVAGRFYSILWAPTLTNTFQSIKTEAEYPRNSYADTDHPVATQGFYKVKVELK